MPRKKNKKKQDENENKEEKKDENHETPKDDGNEGVIAFCPCKTQMVALRADSIYESFVPVFCNDCWCHVAAEHTVYHCPKGVKGRCWDHPIGYDICEQCAKKQMIKRNNNDNKDNKDKNIMKKLFNRNKKEEIKENDDDNNNINKKHEKQTLGLNISPTLQCILTQQLFLQQRPKNDDDINTVNHLSVIDEITRLSALSNSTLGQLSYSNKNDKKLVHCLGDLQEMIIKYNALEQLQDKLRRSIQGLSVESYKMIENRLKDWKNWNKYELSEWIMSLDHGRFYKKYCVNIDSETDKINIVKESILQQNICGKHLDLDDKKKDILIQSLGINDFDDRLSLLDHIQNLINGHFKYDQMLALVPPKKEEIPGHEQQINTFDDDEKEENQENEENEEAKLNKNDNAGMVVEVEGVDLNNNNDKK